MHPTGKIAQASPSGPPAAAEDILDIVEPLWEGSSIPWGWIAALSLLVLALSAAAFLLLQRRAGRGGVLPSAEQRAEARFDSLARRKNELPPNRYAFELSEVLKDFLSEKFDDPIRYETAEEFLQRAAEGAASLPDAARDALRDFLGQAEEVKFGKPADAAARLGPLDGLARRIVTLSAIVGQARQAGGDDAAASQKARRP